MDWRHGGFPFSLRERDFLLGSNFGGENAVLGVRYRGPPRWAFLPARSRRSRAPRGAGAEHADGGVLHLPDDRRSRDFASRRRGTTWASRGSVIEHTQDRWRKASAVTLGGESAGLPLLNIFYAESLPGRRRYPRSTGRGDSRPRTSLDSPAFGSGALN